MIYFFHDVIAKTVKIGYSLKPLSRLEQGQTWHAHDLVFIGQIPGTKEKEKELQQFFFVSLVKREWFVDEDVLPIIRKLIIANGTPQSVEDELLRRNKCRERLRGVQVAVRNYEGMVWTVIKSRWMPDGRLELVLLDDIGEEEEADACDCFLLTEWPNPFSLPED